MTDSMRASIGYGQCILLVSKVTNDLCGIVFLWCHYDPFVQHSSAFSENALKNLFRRRDLQKWLFLNILKMQYPFSDLKCVFISFFHSNQSKIFPESIPACHYFEMQPNVRFRTKKLTRNWFDRISSSLDRCCLGRAKSWKDSFFRL